MERGNAALNRMPKLLHFGTPLWLACQVQNREAGSVRRQWFAPRHSKCMQQGHEPHCFASGDLYAEKLRQGPESGIRPLRHLSESDVNRHHAGVRLLKRARGVPHSIRRRFTLLAGLNSTGD